MSDENQVPFNVNVFGIGTLIAVVLCAMGYGMGDSTIQWVVPGLVIVASIAGAMFWPARRAKKQTGAHPS